MPLDDVNIEDQAALLHSTGAEVIKANASGDPVQVVYVQGDQYPRHALMGDGTRRQGDGTTPPVDRQALVESSTGLYPEQYGAAADGTTDDTAALLAAITAADGKKLKLTQGKTYVYSSVLYTATNGLTIDGQGATLKSNLSKTANTAPFWIKGSDVSIQNVHFDFTVSIDPASADISSRPANAHAVRLGGTDFAHLGARVSFVNCTVNNSRNSGLLVQYADRLLVQGNVFRTCLGNGVFVGDSGSHIRIIGNSIYNTGDDGIGVYNNLTTGSRVQDVVIDGNTVELSDAKGIGVGADDVVISNNTVRNTYAAGISPIEDGSFNLYGPRRVVVIGNTVDRGGQNYGGSRLHSTIGTASYGIAATGTSANVSDITIADNVVTNGADRGIHVTAGTDIQITGNKVVDHAANCAISLGNPDDTVFTNVVGFTISGNEALRSVGGIVAGGSTNGLITNNRIQTYKNGGTGTRRGILVGKQSVVQVHGNVIVNDDAGDVPILFYNACQHHREWGNLKWTTGDADLGVTEIISLGDHRIGFGTAAPTTGTWKQGDIVFDTTLGNAQPFGNGWACRAAGTPGTWKQFGSFGVVPCSATATWDPASIADGAQTSTTLAVSNCQLGDTVAVGFNVTGGVPAGALLAGSVTANGTVTVTLFNKTGSALDLASGTLRATCWRHT